MSYQKRSQKEGFRDWDPSEYELDKEQYLYVFGHKFNTPAAWPAYLEDKEELLEVAKHFGKYVFEPEDVWTTVSIYTMKRWYLAEGDNLPFTWEQVEAWYYRGVEFRVWLFADEVDMILMG